MPVSHSRLKIAAALLALALGLPGNAFGQPAAVPGNAGWLALRKFIGQYPGGDQARHQPALTRTAPVSDILKAIATPAERARLESYAVSPPVETIGGDLLAQFCLPHDGAAESAALVIDPAGQTLWLGFYNNTGTSFRTDWVGTEDAARIPASIIAALSKRHDPF